VRWNLSPEVVPFLRHLGFFSSKTAENSEGTADVAAVPARAKPQAAQIFRAEGEVDG